MPYQLAVERVEYEPERDTILYGRLVDGAIDGPEWVSVPTRSGPPYVAWTSGMQVKGPLVSRLTANTDAYISLCLENHPPAHDIIIPCTATGIGQDTPQAFGHIALPQGEELATDESFLSRLRDAIMRLIRRR